MKMLDFYRAVLKTACLVTDDQDRVSIAIDDLDAPLTIKGKRMVLPTREYMRQEDKSGIVLFHPLQEVITQNESEVMARYRLCANTWINHLVGKVMFNLIKLSASPAQHNRLRPDQLDLMRIFKDADKGMFDNFVKLTKAMPAGSIDKSFVNIYLKPKARKGDVIHRRGAIVSFPLYEELKQNPTKPYGVALRKKDAPAISALIDYIFPDGISTEAYNQFSTSDSVPTLEVMLKCLRGLAESINAVIADFKEIVPELDGLILECEWETVLDDLHQFDAEVRLTPMQPGNEGHAEPAAKVPGNTQPQQQQWVTRTPQQTSPQVMMADANAPILTENGKLDMAAMARRAQAAAYQPYQQQQQQYGQGFGFMPMQAASGPEAIRQGAPSWERPGSASYSGPGFVPTGGAVRV